VREFIRTTLIWILVAFVGETAIGPLIDIRGIAPDFTIIALVLLALSAGPVPATVGGFVLGLDILLNESDQIPECRFQLGKAERETGGDRGLRDHPLADQCGLLGHSPG